MRTSHVAVCISGLLLAAGAIAAGCVSNQGSGPNVDASFSYDAGSLPVVEASTDAGSPIDATLDAGADASSPVTLSTSPIDFGLVACGSGTASKTYSFTNSGPASITYSANIATGSVFSVSGTSSGTVSPGESGSITIAVQGIPTTSTAGTPLTSTLTIATNVPGLAGVNVPLTVTPQGGSLTVAPSLAGFGQVQLANDGTPIPLTIANVGNAAVTVTFGTPTEPDGGTDPEFGIVYPGSPTATTLVAGATLGDAGATFLPTTPGAKSVVASIVTTDPLCASATGVAMSGTGTAAQVTVGPSPLLFGTTPCGQTSATVLQVTLRNSSPGAVNFTDALGLGTASSPFTINKTMGTVPGAGDAGAGTAVITVTPKAIPVPGSVVPGAYNDTIVVTPSAPDVPPTTITLEESASGAILAVTTSGGTAFNTVTNGTPGTLPFTVTNTGNINAPLGLTVSGTDYTAAFTGTSTAAGDGGTASGNMKFTATTNTTIGGSLTVTTSATLCSVTPPAVSFTATGAVPVASVPGATINLTAICGGGTTSTGFFTITNNGDAPLTLGSFISVTGHVVVFADPSPIAAHGNGILTLQADAIGQGVADGTAIGDTFKFSTNEPGAPQYSVPVSVVAKGANLSYLGSSSISLTACGANTTYTVQNTGTMNAYVTGDSPYPSASDSSGDTNVFDFTGGGSGGGEFATAALVSAGSNVSDAVQVGNTCAMTFTCDVSGSQTFTSSSSSTSSSSVGICIPLPALSLTLDIGTGGTCQEQCCS